MASRVNLNLPPWLIESARAAQYANREALGARSLEAQIKAKVKQRKEAEERAKPLQTRQREGGLLEFQREPTQRIWRRPRVRGEVDVGVGLSRFSVRPGTIATRTENDYEDFRYYGTANGDKWSEKVPNFGIKTTVTNLSGSADGGDASSDSLSKQYSTLEIVLPLGNKLLLILVITVHVTVQTVIRNNEVVAESSFTNVERYSARAITISDFSITDQSIAVPSFVLDAAPPTGVYTDLHFDPYPSFRNVLGDYITGKVFGFGFIKYANWEPLKASSTLGRVYVSQEGFATSSAYQALKSQLQIPFDQYLSQFKAYKNDEDPVPLNLVFEGYPFPPFFSGLFYRLDNLANTRIGTYGEDPDAQVLSDLQPRIPLPTENEIYHTLGELTNLPSSFYELAASPEADRLLIAYDMHGGTYCRDQLAALGITLP
ncbi:MAG: hypothetical protein KGO47_07385 [Cyanobacteria bacterium REEB417]|nr:hypothetical protein [Cyanobacteria bacterium REEB417]